MMQLLLNVILSTLIYLIVSLSFSTIYQVSRFFHITHAITITFGAYFTYLLNIQFGLTLFFAIPLAVVFSIIIVLGMEVLIYKPLKNRKTTSWQLLIVSLCSYVVLQNLISIIWSDDTKSIRMWSVKVGHNILGAYITDIQIITIAISSVLFITTVLFLQYSSLGKQIRAVSSNEELSNIFGICTGRVVLWSFIIGSALAAIAGILIVLDTDMTPTMGLNVFLYGVVVMIIGGIGSYKGLIGGALLLSTAQHLSAYYIDSKWMDATAFIILILFLIWKPLGFSGKRLKKVEI